MYAIARRYYEESFSSHQCTQTKIEIDANKLYVEIMTNNSSISINITYQHLHRSIVSLKNKNPTGMNRMSNKILKLFPSNHLSIVLSCLKNFAITLQTPPHWHVAKMILLSKTKSKVIAIKETKPILLLLCFSKLFEKCFLTHFRQQINEQGVLPVEQSGFRPGHNMTVRLVAIIDQIGQSLSMNMAAVALFVNFRTAFIQLGFDGLWL
jgi:hypothetical protein